MHEQAFPSECPWGKEVGLRGLPSQSGRAQAGFTLMELLSTIAILTVIAAVSVIGGATIHKTMTVARLDNYAKEIYVAAQNRLINMESAGQLASFASDAVTQAHPLGAAPQDFEGDQQAWQRLYYAGSSDAIVKRLIPQEAITSNGDQQGGFVIEFDPVSGAVYSVMYTEDPQFTVAGYVGEGAYMDTEGFHSYVESLGSRSQEDRRAGSYPVGYYCGPNNGGSAFDGMPSSFKPQAQFVNGNELYLHVTCPASTALIASQSGITVKVTLSDGTHSKVLEFAGGSDFALTTAGNIDIDVVLDSMRDGMHFADIAPELTPGANITATVDVSYSGGGEVVLTPAENQPQASANSLFGALADGTASIANLRHLNNMRHAPEWVGRFTQLEDIRFSSAAWANAEATQLSSATRESNLAAYGTAYVNPLSAEEASGPGFAPIELAQAFDYDGQGNKLVDFLIVGSGNTGLFATVPAGATVSNLVLVDPSVVGTSYTGALAGRVEGTVRNCGVHLDIADETQVDKTATHTVGAYAGSLAVGGLVGAALNGASIERCHAAIDVANAQGSDTGGLIGALAGSRVSDSYASGVVYSSSTAGGLVGQASDASIQNCYSTSRVLCESNAGGLIGSVTGGTATVASSRALGMVSTAAGGADGASGGFAGASAGALVATDCSFVRQAGYNDALPVQYAGADARSLSQMAATGLAQGNTHPYAASLMGKKFPFAPVLEDHWGNWPDRAGINPTLAYYERYKDGSVGYYAITSIAGDAVTAVQIDTLRNDLAVAEDGYALLCAWPLDRFKAMVNADPLEELVRADSMADGVFVEMGTDGLVYQANGQTMASFDVHAYRLPYRYQEIDRAQVMSYYDVLGVELPNEDGTGTLTFGYLYNAHFACTAVNPDPDGFTPYVDVPTEVKLRTARHLNALTRFKQYWNNYEGTMGGGVVYTQERDIDFASYDKKLCGRPMNFMDTSSGNAFRNHAIGTTQSPFVFAFKGNRHAIDDFRLPQTEEHQSLFGEVEGGSATDVILRSVTARDAITDVFDEGGE